MLLYFTVTCNWSTSFVGNVCVVLHGLAPLCRCVTGDRYVIADDVLPLPFAIIVTTVPMWEPVPICVLCCAAYVRYMYRTTYVARWVGQCVRCWMRSAVKTRPSGWGAVGMYSSGMEAM